MIRQLHAIAADVRELPLALAHAFAVPRPFSDQARLDLLNRVFSTMSPADQLRCRAEFLECREAKRGNRFAEVV